MDIFVKSFSTYRTIKQATAVSHSLVLDALDRETSTVTVAGSGIDRSDAGNWLIADGQVFRIADVKPETDRATLTLEAPLEAFQRPLEFDIQPNDQTVGGFITAQLQAHWAACDDPVYALPYLNVSNVDTTPFALPELDSSGCFSLTDYARLMRKAYRVTVTFADSGRQLACMVQAVPASVRNVSFEDGRSQLQSVAFSYSGLAKITALHDIDTGEKNAAGDPVYLRERSTWYLSEDGEISQLIPSRRAPGEWGSVYVKGTEDVRTKVVEAFAKNKTNHKLEFWSTLDIPVQADCVFLVYGQLLRSYISFKRKSSTDGRYYYKSGELATTATEKLKGVIK
jgi:hypothetical protein